MARQIEKSTKKNRQISIHRAQMTKGIVYVALNIAKISKLIGIGYAAVLHACTQ